MMLRSLAVNEPHLNEPESADQLRSMITSHSMTILIVLS